LKAKAPAWVSYAIASFAVAADQATKFWALNNLETATSQPVIGDLLSWRLAFNDAAAFSLGLGATWILTTISLIASVALLIFSPRAKSTVWVAIAGLIMGGAIGNLIDRLFREPEFFNGHVVDFIQIPFNFPIFNLADTFLVIGVSLAILRTLLGDPIGGVLAHRESEK
jgi:signal peptidase II